MAELLIAAGMEAALAATVSTVIQVGAVAASVAVSQNQARRAKRRSVDAYNASLTDQMITVKGGVNPRPLVYGRAAAGGQLIYCESYGATNEYLLMVIAYAHGEIDAIEQVYFNDAVVDIAGDGAVTTAPYSLSGNLEYALDHGTVPASAPYQMTLTYTPQTTLQVTQALPGQIWTGGDGGGPIVLTQGVDFTVSGTTVTFNSAHAGQYMQIAYHRTAATQSFAYVWKYLGWAGQDLSVKMAQLGAPSWTAADKCQGMAALIVRLQYAENVWPTGVPNIKCVMRGRRVYDPRTAGTAWSRNAALCARDYLTFQYGIAAASAKIDDAGATNGAANICDEDVLVSTGPDVYQDRYCADGVISTGDDRLTNLEALAQAMAGSINYSQGKWRIRAGAYTAPALSLNESHLSDAGSIEVVPYASRRNLINGAKGTFINADAGYVEDQFPVWESSAFITDDGDARLTEDLTLRLVTNAIAAQRLAKIAVYRSREQLTLTVACNFSTYAWQVGDMVSVTLARYGFSAKAFRIVDRAFSADGGMRYTLREEPSGIYEWNLGDPTVLIGAANTTLPNPTVVPTPVIVGITSAQWLYRSGDGTWVPRIRVEIQPISNEYVTRGGKIQLAYKAGDWSEQDWVSIEADGDATALWIDPAFDGRVYLIRVRARNSVGYASAWCAPQAHKCLGRPGQIVNLCLNSNFTQDMGYGTSTYPDARALRHWGSFGNGMTPAIGRNYDNGRTWNIGPGGCYMYSGAPNAGNQGIYQIIPIPSSTAIEFSVWDSIHRCSSAFSVNWLTSAQAFISSIGPDSVDAGNGSIGSATNPDGQRLWLSATAPANAAYAQVVLSKYTTNTGSSDSYLFASKVMVCLAPSGVTKETATPWVDDALNTIDGALIGRGTVTEVLSVYPANGSVGVAYGANSFPNPQSVTYTITSLSITNSTAAEFDVQCGFAALTGSDVFGVGTISLYVTVDGVPQSNAPYSEYIVADGLGSFGGVYVKPLAVGSTMAVQLRVGTYRFSSGGGGTCTFQWRDTSLNLQGIRK